MYSISHVATLAIRFGFVLAFFWPSAVADEIPTPQDRVQIELVSSEVLEGEPIDMSVTGLSPGQAVRLRASRFSGRRQIVYSSSAVFFADPSGRIDPFTDAPAVATWRGPSETALFTTMKADPEVSTEVFSGKVWRDIHFQWDTDLDGEFDQSTWVKLLPSDRELLELTLGEEHPGGFLMRCKSAEPLPVIIALGGSEGGDSAARSIAPQLAARGFACIGLPYYSPVRRNQQPEFPGLPTSFTEIPLDRIESVLRWIEQRDDLDSNRVALWGVSKGAEMALAAASRINKFQAVVAIVPSDVIWQGWGGKETTSSFSWRGEPLPFVPYLGMSQEFAKGSRGQAVRIRLPHDAGRLANPDRVQAAMIDVTAIDCPVMVVGGDEDNTWDSGGMARNIHSRRTEAALATEIIVSKDAGHYLSGTAYTNLDPANAKVREMAFPNMMKFFRQHLRGKQLTSDAD